MVCSYSFINNSLYYSEWLHVHDVSVEVGLVSVLTEIGFNFLAYFLGCQNTPAKGLRYCEVHKDVAREYQNDEEPFGKQSVVEQQSGLLIVGIKNEKSLRQQSLYEVFRNKRIREIIVSDFLKKLNYPLAKCYFCIVW